MKSSRTKKIDSQSGSMALAAITSLCALGLSFIAINNSVQKQKTMIDGEKQKRAVEGEQLGFINSASRFKAMLSNRKKADGTYVPALFATNYYDAKWTLTSDPLVALGDAKLLSGSTLEVHSPGQSTIELSELPQIFGSNGTSLILNDSLMRVTIDGIEHNSNPNPALANRYVESVDVLVEVDSQVSKQKKQSRFRIATPRPKPFNPILEISPANAETWTRDLSKKLPPGFYDIRVLASGIAYDAEIFLNDGSSYKPIGVVGGFDKAGKIKHGAVNYLAEEQEIGRVTSIGLGDAGGTGDNGACWFASIAKSYKLKAQVNGPDSSESVVAESPNLQIQDSPEAEVDLNALVNACSSECPYLGNNDDLSTHLAAGNVKIATTENIFYNERTAWGMGNKKLCVDFKPAIDEFKRLNNQTNPPSLGHLDYSLFKVWAYSPLDCKNPQWVFDRGTHCGCFKDDTRILLGDQKTEKFITDLNEDDLVWSPIRQKAFRIRRMTRGPEKIPMLAIQAGAQWIQVTTKHPFPIEGGLKTADALQIGERIKLGDGSWAAISSINAVIPEEGKEPVVWNLELEAPDDDLDAHQVVANGVITGDLFVQILLQEKSGKDRDP